MTSTQTLAAFDSILLVAFGGPTSGDQSYDFVKGIVGNRPAGEARIREVAGHYEKLNGSPFNALTYRQAEALKQELVCRGLHVPIYCGMRHWKPYVRDVLHDMARAGCKNTLAVILAPHQCWISWDWYQNTVQEGNTGLAGRALTVTYTDPLWTAPEFIEANADRIREAFMKLGTRADSAQLIFSAHAIPIHSCPFCRSGQRKCPYSDQFEESARLVARVLGRDGNYLTCYQSQAEFFRPWTTPDVNELIRNTCHKQGVGDVVISPIGFLVDHVEVLWDLDVEARKTCQECGIGYTRAETVGTHPAFIRLLGDRIAARFEDKPRIEAPLH
ncbi:MAG: ferrochelatase [Planctomycetes bacterium]|nr:ferrochelatase [Planctomycetota bacterium]